MESRRVLMCKPDHFGVHYKINPWMEDGLKNPPDLIKANKQWKNLKKIYENLAIECKVMQQIPGFPDMVFTANAGLVDRQSIILSHFRHKQRRGEVPYFTARLRKLRFTIKHLPKEPKDLFFEGGGDALPFGKNQILFGYGGKGFRSSEKGVKSAANLLLGKTPTFLKLVNKKFYHLDTCLCVMGEVILYYPRAFTPQGIGAIRGICGYKFIEAPKIDAEKFVCNGVFIKTSSGQKFLICNPVSDGFKQELWKEWGIKILESDTSEFIKAGGAQRCLTLFL